MKQPILLVLLFLIQIVYGTTPNVVVEATQPTGTIQLLAKRNLLGDVIDWLIDGSGNQQQQQTTSQDLPMATQVQAAQAPAPAPPVQTTVALPAKARTVAPSKPVTTQQAIAPMAATMGKDSIISSSSDAVASTSTSPLASTSSIADSFTSLPQAVITSSPSSSSTVAAFASDTTAVPAGVATPSSTSTSPAAVMIVVGAIFGALLALFALLGFLYLKRKRRIQERMGILPSSSSSASSFSSNFGGSKKGLGSLKGFSKLSKQKDQEADHSLQSMPSVLEIRGLHDTEYVIANPDPNPLSSYMLKSPTLYGGDSRMSMALPSPSMPQTGNVGGNARILSYAPTPLSPAVTAAPPLLHPQVSRLQLHLQRSQSSNLGLAFFQSASNDSLQSSLESPTALSSRMMRESVMSVESLSKFV